MKYRIAGIFGTKLDEFGESSVICQTKPSKLVVTINNLLANLFICQFLNQTCSWFLEIDLVCEVCVSATEPSSN